MAIKFVILQYALDVVKTNWTKSSKVFWLCPGKTWAHMAGPCFEANIFTDDVFIFGQLPSARLSCARLLDKSSAFEWPQSQASKIDFWFAYFQLFLKDNGTFMVYIIFSRGRAVIWLHESKRRFQQVGGKSRDLGGLKSCSWEGVASQSQKPGGLNMVCIYPNSSLSTSELLTFKAVKMGFSAKKKKKSCRGHLYFSCWDGNIRIYPCVYLYAKFWEYHAACCYTKVVHPWPTLKETKNILSLAFMFCFVFLVGGKITHGNTWGREGDTLSLPHLSQPG